MLILYYVAPPTPQDLLEQLEKELQEYIDSKKERLPPRVLNYADFEPNLEYYVWATNICYKICYQPPYEDPFNHFINIVVMLTAFLSGRQDRSISQTAPAPVTLFWSLMPTHISFHGKNSWLSLIHCFLALVKT